MIIVLIAGGSGTRLWPLSTPSYPKHLLTVNGSRSLLQETYDRAKTIGDSIYVVPEIGHVRHVREQLPELDEDAFIVEPDRRGTASCIIAALHHIYSRHEASEPIAFLAADHNVRDTDGFKHSFLVAATAAKEQKRIVLVGVEPDYPATGFGYIQKGEVFDEEAFIYNVYSFKEKPAFDVAKQYVKNGNYLWNCSYFVGTLEAFVAGMKHHAPEMYGNYQKLLETKSVAEYTEAYLAFENNTIDYALMEKLDDLLVVPASFDWMDLGSYVDLHKAVLSDQNGNHVSGKNVELDGVENCFVQNHEEVPLAVIGLDNVVVINTDHGVLVARKDLAQNIGVVSKKFHTK